MTSMMWKEEGLNHYRNWYGIRDDDSKLDISSDLRLPTCQYIAKRKGGK